MQRIIGLQFQDILPLDAEHSFVKRRVEGRSSSLDKCSYAKKEISPITWPVNCHLKSKYPTTWLQHLWPGDFFLHDCPNSFAKTSYLGLQECTIDLKQGLKRDWAFSLHEILEMSLIAMDTLAYYEIGLSVSWFTLYRPCRPYCRLREATAWADIQ